MHAGVRVRVFLAGEGESLSRLAGDGEMQCRAVIAEMRLIGARESRVVASLERASTGTG